MSHYSEKLKILYICSIKFFLNRAISPSREIRESVRLKIQDLIETMSIIASIRPRLYLMDERKVISFTCHHAKRS